MSTKQDDILEELRKIRQLLEPKPAPPTPAPPTTMICPSAWIATSKAMSLLRSPKSVVTFPSPPKLVSGLPLVLKHTREQGTGPPCPASAVSWPRT